MYGSSEGTFTAVFLPDLSHVLKTIFQILTLCFITGCTESSHLFFFKKLQTPPPPIWRISPLWSMQHMLWCPPVWGWNMTWSDVMCKYWKRSNGSKMQVYVKKPTGKNENHAKNNVMMNVVRNIFLYFEIITKKQRTKIRSGQKAFGRTLQRECFY